MAKSCLAEVGVKRVYNRIEDDSIPTFVLARVGTLLKGQVVSPPS